jgi:hypothetical protein
MRAPGRILGCALAGCVIFVSQGGAVVAGPVATTASNAKAHDGQHDFDYLVGAWKIHLKRRMRPLTGSNDWIEFDGTVVCRQVWNGHAEVEEFNVDSAQKNIHIHGLAVRLYNPASGQWSIYWANEKNGVMDAVPQIGHFNDGHGEFYSQDTQDGKPIFVRFSWTNTTSSSPHFEQSYSDDGGKTWEVNWITEQTRVNVKEVATSTPAH